MKARVKHIFDSAGKDLDAIVFFNGTEPHLDNGFFYSTGLVNGLFEGSAAILSSGGGLHIVTSQLEETSARHAKGARITTYKDRDHRAKVLARELRGLKRVGFNSAELTYHGYKVIRKATKARLVDAADGIRDARMVKDGDEIARLREAGRIASRAADKVPGLLSAGMGEYELAAELNHIMQRLGASGPAFTTISSFGPNTAEPHYTCGQARLKRGQFVLTDFGAMYMKYVSDITRTCVFGRASREQKEMYRTVLEAQRLALDTLRAGVDAADVDLKVRRFIDKTRFRGRFIHSTGHTIGLAVHDGGTMTQRIRLKLREGMVFTVEPGVYLPGKGGVRIEDDVVIRRDGVELLTDAKKELVEV